MKRGEKVKHGRSMDGVDANEEAHTHLAFYTKGSPMLFSDFCVVADWGETKTSAEKVTI